MDLHENTNTSSTLNSDSSSSRRMLKGTKGDNAIKYNVCGNTSIVAFALIIMLGTILVSTGDAASVRNGVADQQTANTATQSEDRHTGREFEFAMEKRIPYTETETARLYFKPAEEFYKIRQNYPYTERRLVGYFDSKRSKPARFSFGLGKRSDETFQPDNMDDFSGAQDDIDDGRIDKRAAGRYQFGIGKRSKNSYL